MSCGNSGLVQIYLSVIYFLYFEGNVADDEPTFGFWNIDSLPEALTSTEDNVYKLEWNTDFVYRCTKYWRGQVNLTTSPGNTSPVHIVP